ncbi:DUF2642 domain-containing protein [Virgibacillus senegalensis]|uniref:DUF2642 domain-containing protein n=1 Tax=Virgibacillus senegalensis TaxID=1499679 RepID=UPI000B23EC8B|nr:DUF2642 domain-containing protein [Virgibacillus senegalensis]
MELLKKYVMKNLQLEISGKKIVKGKLLEVGSDIIVLYDGNDFLYIPSIHIQHVFEEDEEDIQLDEALFPPDGNLSFRKTLTNAKGIFSEIFVTGSLSIHGYVTSILNDYFVFYSPVYKTMYIPFQHLKWLIPYDDNRTPYALEKEKLPVNPLSVSLSRTFYIQLEKFIGNIIVIDLGFKPGNVGQLTNLQGNLMEITTARGTPVFINLNHIKAVHFQ